MSLNWGTKDSPVLLGLEAEQEIMKIGRFCALLAFALCFTFENYAQKAVLNNCYVVHKDWDRAGTNQGMRFHVNLSVSEKKGQDVWCIIEIGYYDGEKIYYVSRSGGNYTYNGHLAISTKLTPSYDNSTWNDLQLFLPYNEFHQVYGEKSGYLIITYCVKVIDSYGQVLLEDWQTTKRICYKQQIFEPTVCRFCNGTGICLNCNGRGGKYIQYYNSYATCNHCLGTGKCHWCSGAGKKKGLSDWFYSYEYDPNANAYDKYPDYYEESNSHIGNYRDTESSSKTICPSCHGSGKCSWCAGRGEYRNRYDDELEDCSNCRGGGLCPVCHGKGYFR